MQIAVKPLQNAQIMVTVFVQIDTANILTVLTTAFGSFTYATVICLYILQPKIAIDLKLDSLHSTVKIFAVFIPITVM